MKKLFIVLIMLITSFVAKPIDGDINNTNENITQNLITEQVIVEEPNNNAEEIVQVEEKQEQEQIRVEIQEEKKETESIVNNITENKTQKKEQKNNSVKTTPVQEQPAIESKSEPEPVEEIKPTATPAKKEEKHEEKIYCVDGGKIHIYGDGANEHGYYKTWDEAFNAYEEYTKGWESTQFKVDQCACGLYYFWVIK